MEAATLTSPQRKFSVVPVQKSLSLPSYARAGGGGIDHKLIFAALEQKEKGRRKSRLFTREKKRNTNIFCLPISSSRHEKCRETSFSSDTSCSSLEYQPKKAESKSKTSSEAVGIASTALVTSSTTRTVEVHRIRPSLIDNVVRLNVGSSDSMERSSRSSTDSFNRKERLVAIKARVEAEREKYRDSSSEEESCSTLSRYNSDGSIHRSGREYKSKSSRTERRLRRRSQGEFSNVPSLGFAKTNRKKNLNLPHLNIKENGVHLHLERSSKVNNDNEHLDIKTDFCPSPNFPDLMKKNYFSDFPSRENSARFVQARIRLIEDEERKRRSGSDFKEKVRTPPRQSPQNLENASPASTERRFQFERQNSSTSSIFEKNANTSSMDFVGRASPSPRSTQAPTPPPRSPKSINFVNKALIQHQNASLRKKENVLDPKKSPGSEKSGISYADILEQFNAKNDALSNSMKYSAESLNDSSDKQRFRELINSRRKTCSNFDFLNKNILDDLCSIKSPVSPSTENKKFTSVMHLKGQESKGCFSGSETPRTPSDENIKIKERKSKWQENEQRREYMFNSLESKKSTTSSRSTSRNPSKVEACLCRMFPEEKFMCICKSDLKENDASPDLVNFIKKDILNPIHDKNVCILPIKASPDRLCKSEVNISSKKQNQVSSLKLENDQGLLACKNVPREKNSSASGIDNKSASANLESAMEELESVYRSLKFSSDNLSDPNSVSNASLSDDGSKGSKLKANECSSNYGLDLKRRSSVCESNWKSDPHKISINIGQPNKITIKNNSAFSPLNSPVSEPYKALDTNQMSIDELFNNMTMQLDNLEQNFVKKPEYVTSQKSTSESNCLDQNKPTSNKVSKISIRKEFFDNLSKSNQVHVTSKDPDKKKHKAVRSLSENIAHLMASPNSSRDKNNSSNLNEPSNKYLHTSLDQPCSERTHVDVFHETNRNKVDNNDVAQCPRRSDEICHIRVSMDSNPSKLTIHETRPYPRLSSAVSSPQKVPIHDVESNTSKSADQASRPYNRLSSCMSPSSNILSKDSDSNQSKSTNQETRSYTRLNSALTLTSSKVPFQNLDSMSSKLDDKEITHYLRLNTDLSSPRAPIHDLNPSKTTSQESKSYCRSSGMSSPSSRCSLHDLDSCLSKSADQESKPYPRSNSRLSPSSEVHVQDSEQGQPIPKDSVDVEGLEKLLNSLLGEVPDRPPSSLVQSSNNPATPPPPSSGEMRVLQHLDVIRLKPVPS